MQYLATFASILSLAAATTVDGNWTLYCGSSVSFITLPCNHYIFACTLLTICSAIPPPKLLVELYTTMMRAPVCLLLMTTAASRVPIGSGLHCPQSQVVVGIQLQLILATAPVLEVG